MKEFLRPSLISLNTKASDWKEAFEISGKLLLDAGYINQDYIEKMIQTAAQYGDYMIICDLVALPHAKASDGVIKTGFSFVMLDKPVYFTFKDIKREIKFIVGLAADENISHLKAMGELIDLVYREDKLKYMFEITDTTQFIEFVSKNI